MMLPIFIQQSKLKKSITFFSPQRTKSHHFIFLRKFERGKKNYLYKEIVIFLRSRHQKLVIKTLTFQHKCFLNS